MSQMPVMAVHPHEHLWVPWYNVWFGLSYVPDDKVFSNGRGCLICREPQFAPWNHPYVAEADGVCVTCGQVGAYIHTKPSDR